MLEIKISLELEAGTKALATRFLDLVDSGKLGNYSATLENVKDDAAQTPTEPVKQPKRAQSPTGGETPAAKPNKAVEPETPAQDEPKAQPTEKSYDIEDIRALLADAKHAHGIDAVKALLKKYGAATGKLAEVPAEKYAELAADIAALGE